MKRVFYGLYHAKNHFDMKENFISYCNAALDEEDAKRQVRLKANPQDEIIQITCFEVPPDYVAFIFEP